MDLETSGLEATDHVVEIAAWDVIPDQGPLSPFFVGASFVKPPVPIPPKASAIHHIVDEDVAGAPSWKETLFWIDDTVDAYCCHNSRFDAQWLGPIVGKPIIDTYRAALRLWPDFESHSNQYLRYKLKPEGLNRQIANESHRARSDAYVTSHILQVILKQPKVTLDGLIQCSSRPALLPRIRFGKHRDKKWGDVDRSYLEWLSRQADLDEDVKFTVTHWLKAVPA